MAGTMIAVNGVYLKSPSVFSPSLHDNSASDAGRVQDGNDTMYKNRTSQKWSISIAWNGLSASDMSTIMQAFNAEYIMLTFTSPLTNTVITKEFYTGDKSAPVKIWTVNNKRYEQLSFEIIER